MYPSGYNLYPFLTIQFIRNTFSLHPSKPQGLLQHLNINECKNALICMCVCVCVCIELRNELKMIDRGERMYHYFLDQWQVPNAIIKTDMRLFQQKVTRYLPKIRNRAIHKSAVSQDSSL